jgi:Ca2+-binding EF-hand superfamily protein
MRSYRDNVIVGLFVVSACLAAHRVSTLCAQDDEASDEAVFAELDLNEDDLLSGKEVKAVKAYDTNEDGRITKQEFMEGRRKERGVDPAEADEALFTERDISEDGFLSGKEKKGLEKYDSDSDGEITKAEFLAGRRAERSGKPSNTSSEAARRLAEERFAALDQNEDGRLSGTEIAETIKNYDANSDNRITKDEFIAAVLKSNQTHPQVDGKQGLAPVLAALKTMDPNPLLEKCDDNLRAEIDEPVLRFLLELIQSEHGEIQPLGKDDIEVQETEINGQNYIVTEAQVVGENGTINCSVTWLKDQIAGFNIQSSAVNQFNEMIYNALSDEDYGLKMAKFYTPRCEEFIKLVHAGKDEAAFARFHPLIQEKLGMEKAAAFFANVRKTYGKLKSVELESIKTNFDASGKPEDFVLGFMLTTDESPALAEVTLQFDGLKAHLVAFAEEKAQPLEDDDDVPAPPVAPAPPRLPVTPGLPAPPALPAPPRTTDDE